jgi:lipase
VDTETVCTGSDDVLGGQVAAEAILEPHGQYDRASPVGSELTCSEGAAQPGNSGLPAAAYAGGRRPINHWHRGQPPTTSSCASVGLMTASTQIADPFDARYAVAVAGGVLTVAHAGPRPDQADAVVLAIHGITANMMAWGPVARELGSAQLSLLAPDLRGRGESADLPGPYGFAAHVADLLAVLDHAGVQRAVLAGHSMGAYVAARLAAEHPERAASLVLVDGGASFDAITPQAAAAGHALTVGTAMARHAITFPSAEGYLDFWRQHPAFATAWNDDVEAYLLHDLAGKPGAFRYIINTDAIETDSREILSDPISRNAIDRTNIAIRLLRAPRGTLDDEHPMISRAVLDAFTAKHPAAEVEEVAGVNHYTLTLGESAGPPRVAAAIEAAARTVPR